MNGGVPTPCASYKSMKNIFYELNSQKSNIVAYMNKKNTSIQQINSRKVSTPDKIETQKNEELNEEEIKLKRIYDSFRKYEKQLITATEEYIKELKDNIIKEPRPTSNLTHTELEKYETKISGYNKEIIELIKEHPYLSYKYLVITGSNWSLKKELFEPTVL